MFDVLQIRKDFPILAREVNGKPLVYDKDTFEKAAAQRKKGIASVADKIKNVRLEEGEASLALIR